jgi:formate/nitrite transporter FocA (FNT family)
MTIRKTYSLIAIAALLICFAVIFFSRYKDHDKKIFVYAEPVQTVYGWGYNIVADGKVHIKQEYMPAVPGKRGFKSAADAMLVGNLVIEKITENKMPTITLHELDSMGLYRDTLLH